MNGPRILVWGLIGVVVLAIGIAVTRPAPATRADIGNAELRDLQAKGARLVDVRTPGEYAMGHLPGSENVPVEQITQVAAGWPRDAAVIVYCATGSRSMTASQWMAANGFAKVYNLTGGIENWDGQVTKEVTQAPAALKTNGIPVMIDFYSDS